MKNANELICDKINELKEKIDVMYEEINKLIINKQTVKNLFESFLINEHHITNDKISEFINNELDDLVIFTENHNVQTEELGNLKFKIKNTTMHSEQLIISLFSNKNYKDIIKVISTKYNLTIPENLDILVDQINPTNNKMKNIDELNKFISHFQIKNINDEIKTVLNMIKIKEKINELNSMSITMKKFDDWLKH